MHTLTAPPTISGHPTIQANRGEQLAPLTFTVCADCGHALGKVLFHIRDRWKCATCCGRLTGAEMPPLPGLDTDLGAEAGWDFDVEAIREHLGTEIAAITLLEAIRGGEVHGPTAMAEIIPDEGLDLILGIYPKNGTNLGTTYCGLFTSFTASTVGSNSQAMTSYPEPDFGSYLVQSVPAADWGSVAAGTGGRKVVATQKSFPAATSVGSSSAINGSTLRNQSTYSGAKCLAAGNFDEGQVPALAVGDIVRVTPTQQFNN